MNDKVKECTKLYLEYLKTKSPDILKRFTDLYGELDQDGMIQVIEDSKEALGIKEDKRRK